MIDKLEKASKNRMTHEGSYHINDSDKLEHIKKGR